MRDSIHVTARIEVDDVDLLKAMLALLNRHKQGHFLEDGKVHVQGSGEFSPDAYQTPQTIEKLMRIEFLEKQLNEFWERYGNPQHFGKLNGKPFKETK